MVNEDLREKFGVYAKVWLILAGKFSRNPNMADFGVNKEGLEKKIKENAKTAIRGLLKTLDRTSISITPVQISRKDFRDIIDPKKSADVKDPKEVTYNSSDVSFRVGEYQPEGTSKATERRHRIGARFIDECDTYFYWIESGKFKLEGEGYELSVFRQQDSGTRLSIENIPLKEVPEVMFKLLYKPESFVPVEKTGATESV